MIYVEASITVCSSKIVKVYFQNFTFKKPEDEKNCFKKEKPENLAEGNFQKGTQRKEFQEKNSKKRTQRKELKKRNSKKGTPNRKLIFTDVRTCRKQKN